MAGSIVTLSGWGQPHDVLEAVAPGATHVYYAQHGSIEAALADIARQAAAHDTAVGWSLGGQLLVRAVADGLFRPKRLVLIATPYQFVATPRLALGMKRDLYDQFRDNYARNPERTLRKAWALIHKGDTNAAAVESYLKKQDPQQVQKTDWLHWLEMLGGFAFDERRLATFPPTLLIHGDHDVVVDHSQSQQFAAATPRSRLATVKGAGHAPHWHDTKAVRQLISGFAHV